MAYAPAQVQYRFDGWTPARQAAFLAALADTGSVTRAAARVEMSATSAYSLRSRAGAEAFCARWEVALAEARARKLARLRAGDEVRARPRDRELREL